MSDQNKVEDSSTLPTVRLYDNKHETVILVPVTEHEKMMELINSAFERYKNLSLKEKRIHFEREFRTIVATATSLESAARFVQILKDLLFLEEGLHPLEPIEVEVREILKTKPLEVPEL